jgi:Protein of unknown function (DUF2778)
MSYTAGAIAHITPFRSRRISIGNCSRVIFRSGVVGVATLTTAGVIVSSLAITTAWMGLTFHQNKPTVRANASATAPEALVLANPYGSLASAIFGSTRAIDVPETAPRLAAASSAKLDGVASENPDAMFDPRAASDAAETFALIGGTPLTSPNDLSALLSPPLLSPPSAPPQAPPSSKVARDGAPATEMTREAEVTPPPMLPPRRGNERSEVASTTPDAPQTATAPAAPSQSGGILGFFAKLFSGSKSDNSGFIPDARTAVYDIEAHTVYLPSGERLEAHSGMGQWMDDPRSVHIKDRGATPPHVYDLRLRESLFHGVQAIRLTPVGDGQMYGRDGILAHSFMLGPSGQSNGCVSFRDYEAFLRAFRNGAFDRMLVVARLGDKPPLVARGRRGHQERYASAGSL